MDEERSLDLEENIGAKLLSAANWMCNADTLDRICLGGIGVDQKSIQSDPQAVRSSAPPFTGGEISPASKFARVATFPPTRHDERDIAAAFRGRGLQRGRGFDGSRTELDAYHEEISECVRFSA